MFVRRTIQPLLALALLLPFGSSVPTASAAGVPVACGDTLSGIGFLASDLDCTTPEYLPITIKHGRLDLQGFTLQGGIVCEGPCKISNGTVAGSITGNKSVGLRDVVKHGELTTNGNVHVRNSSVSFGQRCLFAYYGKITVQDSVIANCQKAVYANQNDAKINDSTITDARHIGVLGTRVRLKNSTVTGSGSGVECGESPLDRICNGGPDAGLECGPGVDCIGGSCVPGAICADVVSFKPPVIRNSTCGTSAIGSNAGLSWEACSLD
jgi:hypothetical protein